MIDRAAPVPVYFGDHPKDGLTKIARLPLTAMFFLTTQGAVRDYIDAHPETKRS